LLLWELAFPILIFLKCTRRLTLFLGAILHLLIAVVFDIPFFSWVMVVTYSVFLTDEEVAWMMAFRPKVKLGERVANA